MPEPINRKSLTKSLEDRYKSDAAGGAFDAKKASTNTMILGCQAPFGYTNLSQQLTIEPGFTTNMGNNRQENFKSDVLAKDNSTLCKAGFSNKKYKP
jgi:hypothetical protein